MVMGTEEVKRKACLGDGGRVVWLTHRCGGREAREVGEVGGARSKGFDASLSKGRCESIFSF